MVVLPKRIAPRKVTAGHKAKIYAPKGKPTRFGEVLGMSEDGMVLIAERTDFAQLSLHDIDLFLDSREVRIITMDETEYQFQKPDL